MSEYTLYHGDCLTEMSNINENSVDMILCDPPYGTTPLHWDNIINFEKMWEQYHRVAKPNAAVVIFAQEPFASFVRMSNMKEYKYDWYWEKELLTNVFQVKRRPGKVIENICVFYKKQCIYNPQKREHHGKLVHNKVGENTRWSPTQSGNNPSTKPLEYHDDGTRYPTQVLRINRDNSRERLHPTQKPVALCEYLIKTYTNEGMTVLDNCMGSGTTGVACMNTNRNFIGIEIDDNYYNIASDRIREKFYESSSTII